MTRGGVPFPEASSAVLVGGISRRLGRDKVFLEVEGEPLVRRSVNLLSSFFPEVLVVGHPRPGFGPLGIEVIEDLIPGRGALGGLYTAVSAAAAEAVFVMAADMPFVTGELIRRIAGASGDADAVIPKGPRGLEPLCALYRKSCTGPMKRAIDNGIFRIMVALEGLKIVSPEISPTEGAPDPFANINRPEDLAIIKR